MFCRIAVCATLLTLGYGESIGHASIKRGSPHSIHKIIPKHKSGSDTPPSCIQQAEATYCLEDEHYPEEEIKEAVRKNIDKVLHLYADVADLSFENTVDVLEKLENPEDLYVCPSNISYGRPLRGQDAEGKWHIIVNNIQVYYQNFTQTHRLEECTTNGAECNYVPKCYESKCTQKSVYHRLLTYDPSPYSHYFPFKIESLKLPVSCSCFLNEFEFKH